MGFLAGVAPARPQLRAALRPTASGSCLHPMPPRHVPHHPPARLRSQPRPSPQSSATHPPAPAGQRSASGPFFGEFGVFLLALPPGGHGLVQLPVQLPALIAKLPATALNSFSQAPSGIDVVSLSVARKSQAPSSGNSTAALRCLRGGKRPAPRHRPSGRALLFGERSLGWLSVFSGSFFATSSF